MKFWEEALSTVGACTFTEKTFELFQNKRFINAVVSKENMVSSFVFLEVYTTFSKLFSVLNAD